MDEIQAEKTLQTVVGMFGNQDHTARKYSPFIFKILFQVVTKIPAVKKQNLTKIFTKILFISLVKKAKLDAKKKEE